MPIQRDGPLDFRIGDIIRLRKPHPCGSFDWAVYRLGADIGIKCTGCQRRVMLPRKEVERRMKSFVSRPEEIDAAAMPSNDSHDSRKTTASSGSG